MDEENMVFGFCWYHPEQWDRLIEISDDRAKLDDSYESWHRNANKALSEFNATGKIVKKVKIDLEELLGWCNEKGIPVNGEARAEFVSVIMRRRNEKKS